MTKSAESLPLKQNSKPNVCLAHPAPRATLPLPAVLDGSQQATACSEYDQSRQDVNKDRHKRYSELFPQDSYLSKPADWVLGFLNAHLCERLRQCRHNRVLEVPVDNLSQIFQSRVRHQDKFREHTA